MNTNDVRFRTTEVAKLADVSLRQLQVWEEKRVAVASRAGRVRLYTVSQALFVIVVAELRRRGLSFQRLRRLSVVLRQIQPSASRPPGQATSSAPADLGRSS